MDIKTVIMCHNTPRTTEALYGQLSGLGYVDVFDSGSDEDKRPECPCERFENLYWSGCWKEAMKRYGDADFLWVLGGDVSLVDEPRKYYECLEEMTKHNVGCWSPAVSGSCRGVMSMDSAVGKMWSVYHIEGIAMVASRSLMREMGYSFPARNKYGWGLDMWMSYLGWDRGMRNVIDGRVSIVHPAHRGYDSQEAWDEMCLWMEEVYGKDWMQKIRFNYRDGFRDNVREIRG